MRIALINQPWSQAVPNIRTADSVALWTEEVAQRLARFHEVAVFSRLWPQQAMFEKREGLEYRRVASPLVTSRMAARPSGSMPAFAAPGFNREYFVSVLEAVRDWEGEIILLPNFSQFVPLARQLLPQAKIILHMHSEWLSQLRPDMLRPRLEQADLITGVSDFVTDPVRRRFPELARRCATVYNGVDIEEFSGTPGGRAAHSPRLFYAGRVSPEKGLHVLIEAFRVLLKTQPDLELSIAGPAISPPPSWLDPASTDPLISALAPYYRGEYVDLVRLPLSPAELERIHFLGHVGRKALVECYKAADVFVFPSIWAETFGIPIVEAMAAGLPVVATRGGGIPEIVVDNATGFLVERGDTATLITALEKLLADGALRARMGRAGQCRAETRFTWDRTVESLAGLIRGL